MYYLALAILSIGPIFIALVVNHWLLMASGKKQQLEGIAAFKPIYLIMPFLALMAQDAFKDDSFLYWVACVEFIVSIVGVGSVVSYATIKGVNKVASEPVKHQGK
ncbi:MAG: hypothetical protein Q7S53_00870 [bacterium]|nr:hypothetical protein [bacterium]